jgi:hypothetical protein
MFYLGKGRLHYSIPPFSSSPKPDSLHHAPARRRTASDAKNIIVAYKQTRYRKALAIQRILRHPPFHQPQHPNLATVTTLSRSRLHPPPMSGTSTYWPRITLLSLAGIYAISLVWSLSPFVKSRLYPSACSDSGTKQGAKTAADGQDTACGYDSAFQTEMSEPEEQDGHTGAHNSHTKLDVRSLLNEPTATSHLQDIRRTE